MVWFNNNNRSACRIVADTSQRQAQGVKVVDGIFQLAGPCTPSDATSDIVLFHGLSLDGEEKPDSYYRTWRAAGTLHERLCCGWEGLAGGCLHTIPKHTMPKLVMLSCLVQEAASGV